MNALGLVRIIIGGLIGFVLAIHGLTVLTWGFWAVIALTFALYFTVVCED